jgi:RNA recognition motif-containing protein
MANEKNTIYVGGLADDVNEKLLHDIFIIFGSISEIQASYHFHPAKRLTTKRIEAMLKSLFYRCPLIMSLRNTEGSRL